MATGIQNMQQKIKRLGRRLEKEPRRSVERGAAAMVADMKAEIVENDAVASTELFRGIVINRGDVLHGDGSSIRVVSTASHSGFVEFGTGAFHRPNPYTQRYEAPSFSGRLVSALIEWATIKPSVQTENPGALGWAVARVISGEADDTDRPPGTKAQPFFFITWKKHKSRIVARAASGMRRAARW